MELNEEEALEPCLIHEVALKFVSKSKGMHFDSLSDREQAIVRAMRDGSTNEQIRARYHIGSTRLSELRAFV